VLDGGRIQTLTNINSKLPEEKALEEGLTRLRLKNSKSLSSFQKKITILRTQEYIHSVEIKIDRSKGLSKGASDLKSRDDILAPSFDKRFHREDD
jgi:hypothetical protein